MRTGVRAAANYCHNSWMPSQSSSSARFEVGLALIHAAPGAEFVPLEWSQVAMLRALERARSTGWNDPQGVFAAVGETVWWICVLDEQLRAPGYHLVYEAALAEEPPTTEPLLSGLRHVRDRMAHAVDEVNYLIATPTNAASFEATWTWRPLPPWRDTRHPQRYEAYQAALAGRDLRDTLPVATVFVAGTATRAYRSYWEKRSAGVAGTATP